MKTIFNIVRIEKALNVDGGGSTTTMGSTKASAKGSLEGGAQDASRVEDSTRGCLELAFN